MDPEVILNILKASPAYGPLVIFIVGLMRKWFVLGWAYKEKVKECDEWKAIALQNTHLFRRGIEEEALAKQVEERVTAQIMALKLQGLGTERGRGGGGSGGPKRKPT